MKKLTALLRLDSLLAFRYGLMYAAIFIFLVYLGVFIPLSGELRSMFLPFIIYIDLAIFGFYFLGAWVFFERQENTLNALMVTPIAYQAYLWSKITILTLISLIISLALAFILITDFTTASPILLIISTFLNSVLFCMIGLWIVARYTSFSHFLPISIIMLFFFQLPVFDYFQLIQTSTAGSLLWLLHPTYGSMKLISLSFDCCLYGWAHSEIIGYLSLTLFWIVIFQRVAFRAFRHYILEKRSTS
jgi:fluoroquinolone transport system permease protein